MSILGKIFTTKAGAIAGGAVGGAILAPFGLAPLGILIGKAAGAYLGSGGSILSAILPGIADGVETVVGLPDLPEEALRAKTAAVSAATDKAAAASAVIETSASVSTSLADTIIPVEPTAVPPTVGVDTLPTECGTGLTSYPKRPFPLAVPAFADASAAVEPSILPLTTEPDVPTRECATGINDSQKKTFADLVVRKHGGIHTLPLSQELPPDASEGSAAIFNIVSSDNPNTLAGRDGQGNPDDRNGHGNRPTDGHGNPAGRDVHGNRPGNVLGWN